MLPVPLNYVARFWRRRSWKQICFTIVLPSVIGLCGWLTYVIYVTMRDHFREEAYFAQLERQKWGNDSHHRPYSSELIKPLFPELVQLSSTGHLKSLRLRDDGLCDFPFEHVWIYAAGRSTCPKQDGIEMCEDYINAFDRLLEFHHTQRPAAGAFLSYVDCDVSHNLCQEWGIESNIIINMQSLSPCEPHMPDADDPEYYLQCPVLWRYLGLPLERMPYKSTNIFPSAFEQLKALTSVNGFIDAIDPVPQEIASNFTDLMKLKGQQYLSELAGN